MNVFEPFKKARWLAKLNKRDQETFSQCYDFYAPKIYRHAFYRLGSRELAEDVTSEVFLKTWQFLADPSNKIDNLKGFLYRIANNLIIDYYRTKGQQPILIDEALERQISDNDLSTKKTINKLDFEIVLKSLEKLNQETREILVWRYVDELSIGEIAKITGKTANAIYVTIHRGLKELKKLTNK